MDETARTGTPWAWIAVWAAVGAGLALWMALVPLEGVAHVQDEVVYRLQARLLSEGHLWEPERLPRAAHYYRFVTNWDGRRYGIFPNGWPAVLALGMLAAAPWGVNPALHGLTTLLGGVLAHRFGGRTAALLAAPFLALNPGLLFQAASGMSHTLCALLTLAAVTAATASPSRRRALALGSALGWLVLTRPLDAVAVGALLGIHALWKRQARLWLWALAPIGVALVLVGLQNLVYEGNVLRFPQNAWFDRGEPPFVSPGYRFEAGCNRLGLGPDRGCEQTFGSFGHTAGKALQAATFNLRLAATLWLGHWLATPALLAAGRRSREFTALALAAVAALAGAYSLYWYGGVCLGPRFLHAAAPLVIIALALGVVGVLNRVPGLSPLAGLVLVPVFAVRLAQGLPELPGYWGVDGRLDRLEANWDRGPALMLVAYGPEFSTAPTLAITTGGGISRYTALQRRGMWVERPDSPLAYAEYQPALVEATRARYPDRPAFLLVLSSDPANDYVAPLPAVDAEQVDDLPLPVDPTPMGLRQ